MDNKLEISLLYDFYGKLIPEPQQKAIELYVNDDLSLSEVADILGISRQGVRDSLGRASKKLRDFEAKLGLLGSYRERVTAAAEIKKAAETAKGLADNEELRSICEDIIALTDKLNEREDLNGI